MNSKRPTTKGKQGHPSGDDRYKAIDRTMKRFKHEKDALLEVLNAAQETFGYLSEDLHGVATFYHLFSFEPLGEHNCIICTGTACHVKGSGQIVEALSDAFHIQPGETTPDRLFSLTTARCLGSCGLAPVVVVDGQVSGKETPDAVVRRVTEIISFTEDELQHEAEEG